MQYNPNKHHRRSIRLKRYEYSRAGLYFITICTQNRAHLFGEIIRTIHQESHVQAPLRGRPEKNQHNRLILNDAGRMVEKWYHELENKYPDKRCHEMIVMPNHFHCIIENVPRTDAHVGAPLRGRPENERDHPETHYGIDNKKFDATIGNTMDWFKTMTTNEYIHGVKQFGWQRFDGKLWQRNYWEHIIRNEKSYLKISEYIRQNPANWNIDTLK